MTPELIAAIIAVLGALAGWLKSHSEVSSVKAERLETKAQRDRDSQELHDKVLKLEFQCGAYKDALAAQQNKIEDTNSQVSVLNTQIAKILVTMDNMDKKLDELKADIKKAE